MARLIAMNGAHPTIGSALPKRDRGGDVSLADAVLPEQFFSRTATAAPERRLMFAILLDAVMQLERRGTVGAEEAKRWICRAVDGPCSFRSTCEAVGIEPTYLGRHLLAWYAGDEPRLLGSARLLRTSGNRRTILPWRRRQRGRTSDRAMPSSSAPRESSRRLLSNEA